jgi:hypothetical protein
MELPYIDVFNRYCCVFFNRCVYVVANYPSPQGGLAEGVTRRSIFGGWRITLSYSPYGVRAMD